MYKFYCLLLYSGNGIQRHDGRISEKAIQFAVPATARFRAWKNLTCFSKIIEYLSTLYTKKQQKGSKIIFCLLYLIEENGAVCVEGRYIYLSDSTYTLSAHRHRLAIYLNKNMFQRDTFSVMVFFLLLLQSPIAIVSFFAFIPFVPVGLKSHNILLTSFPLENESYF